MPAEKSSHRESFFAWTATAIACLYCAWLAVTLWHHASSFGAIFRDMGVELSSGTRMVVEHAWIGPLLFGILALIAVIKEWLVADKRISVMLNFVLMMLGHWAADAITAQYQQPLFDIMHKVR